MKLLFGLRLVTLALTRTQPVPLGPHQDHHHPQPTRTNRAQDTTVVEVVVAVVGVVMVVMVVMMMIVMVVMTVVTRTIRVNDNTTPYIDHYRLNDDKYKKTKCG